MEEEVVAVEEGEVVAVEGGEEEEGRGGVAEGGLGKNYIKFNSGNFTVIIFIYHDYIHLLIFVLIS